MPAAISSLAASGVPWSSRPQITRVGTRISCNMGRLSRRFMIAVICWTKICGPISSHMALAMPTIAGSCNRCGDRKIGMVLRLTASKSPFSASAIISLRIAVRSGVSL